MKQPIAMRCTKKQFKSVKNKLKKTEDIESFKHNPYLVTNLCNIDGLVSNVDKKRSRDYNRKIYEEWNEKIFLEALGIETEGAKDIILEKVKEYFKNAKTVRCLHNLKEASIIDNITSEIYGDNKDFWINSTTHDGEGILLYDNGKFAEILTYKEKTFSITESQIKDIYYFIEYQENADKFRSWFPDAFKVPEAFESEVKLEAGKWYKNNILGGSLFYVTEFESNYKNAKGYGFENGEWYDKYIDNAYYWDCEEGFQEAKEQEVFEALKNEAEKRYIKGSFVGDFLQWNHGTIHEMFSSNQISDEEYRLCFKYNHLFKGNLMVFSDGVWIKTIPTIALSEAEQQLGKKIIV